MEALTAIAQQLECQAQATRIKKLLLYATAGYWESDVVQLEAAAIPPMLSQLCQLYPTQQQLRFYLHTIAANLTKPIEYQQLADEILRHCSPLYPLLGEDVDEPTAFFTVNAVQKPVIDTMLSAQQQQIAAAIEAGCDRERMVKLLICLTSDHWESDPQKLAQASVRALIDAVWRLFPSLDEVERSLVSIVQRLSKAVEYNVVATAMVQQLAPLYGHAAPLASPVATPVASPAVASPPVVTPVATPVAAPVAPTPLPLVQSIDGFDLRLEVMKFTNPLRAKLLLFSLLHQPFDQSDAAWSALKRYSLEILLKTLLEQYPPAEIGPRLQTVALQLPHSEDYEQTIDVLLRSLKLPAANLPPLARWGAPDDEDEHTGIRLSPVIVKS